MLKLIAILAGICILAYAVMSWSGGSTLPADPVTASASLDLKVRAQASVTVSVASLSNRIKQTMAAGSSDPAIQRALRDDLAHLHDEVEHARTQLITLGDSPASVDQWLERIHWAELVALETEYTKSITSN